MRLLIPRFDLAGGLILSMLGDTETRCGAIMLFVEFSALIVFANLLNFVNFASVDTASEFWTPFISFRESSSVTF